MADLSATEVWDRVLDDLQIQVTRPTFETWLKQTAGVAVSDDAFVVGAPNAFVAEMLEQRMSSLIAQAVERQVKRRLDVRIEVGNGTAPAAHSANGADVPAARENEPSPQEPAPSRPSRPAHAAEP